MIPSLGRPERIRLRQFFLILFLYCFQQESKQAENTSAKTAISTEDHVIVANQTVTAAGNSRGNKRKIFLQTATTQACAQGNQVPVRVLMDSGSQRTYITDTLKNKLGLVPEKTELLNLNTFGDDKVERRKCDTGRGVFTTQRFDTPV